MSTCESCQRISVFNDRKRMLKRTEEKYGKSVVRQEEIKNIERIVSSLRNDCKCKRPA